MKYQLVIRWKDGSVSGRVIDLTWPLRQPLRNVEKFTLKRYRPGHAAGEIDIRKVGRKP
jgi:hypothetical protein